MTIKFIKYKTTNEHMLFINLVDDDGRESKRMPFYNKIEDVKKDERLAEAVLELPELLEQVYNMGKAGQTIEFQTVETNM